MSSVGMADEVPDADYVVAVLHSAVTPPGRSAKPPKPGGYRDSGADIAYALRQAGIRVVTPVPHPDPCNDADWSFPDTESGIAWARAAGANTLFANTLLFDGHPLQRGPEQDSTLRIVGNPCALVQRFDDKFATNRWLRLEAGLTVAPSCLIARDAQSALSSVEEEDSFTSLSSPSSVSASLPLPPPLPPLLLDELLREAPAALTERLRRPPYELRFPLVVKPVRGRGSEGVTRVDDAAQLCRVAHALLTPVPPQAVSRYGTRLMLEPFLPGDEITVTVLPPGRYGALGRRPTHWSLPAVRRRGHADGVAPYSGVVPVLHNSEAVPAADEGEAVREARRQCERAAACMGVVAPLRIDCRADAAGRLHLFDVNLKPNMTGPGRPGREAQDSLVLLAARTLGWSYADLLLHMVRNARGGGTPPGRPSACTAWRPSA